MVDCLVVGFGISGVSITAHFEALGKKVIVVDGKQTKASVVAGGMYNPVILKRFSLAWDADNQLDYAKEFYSSLEKRFKVDFNTSLNIYRKFTSIKEQNTWFSKLENPVLNKYMCSELASSPSSSISDDFNFGKLKGTGRVEVEKLIDIYKKDLLLKEAFIEEDFDYAKLKIKNDSIVYKDICARNIVFCEGYGLKKNPFFNKLPLVGNKGSYIVFECKELLLHDVLKTHFFLIPLGNNKYKFGATYENHFKDKDHDSAAKLQLINELEKLISTPYVVIEQLTGIRPTVIDRKPLVGRHSQYNNLYVCNGLGTRGIIIAPTSAKLLVNNIVKGSSVPAEININRFY